MKMRSRFIHLLFWFRSQCKSGWQLEYVKALKWFAMSGHYERKFRREFRRILTEERSDLLKHTWSEQLYIWDYRLCNILIGAEPEDYFDLLLYNHGWNYRRKVLARTKLIFIIARINSQEQADYLNDKSCFARHWVEFFKRRWVRIPDCSENQFVETFCGVKDLIVKPINRWCGEGIQSIDNIEDLHQVYLELKKLGETVMVEEKIKQRGILHELNPSSVNTIRVCTLKTEKGIQVISAFLRIGAKDAIIDNIHGGGTECDIELSTGMIMKAYDHYGRRVDQNPSTGLQLIGLKIPHWDQVKEICLDAHSIAPEGLHYIGWDVCVSGEEILLIEGNRSALTGASLHGENYWKMLTKCLDEIESLGNAFH